VNYGNATYRYHFLASGKINTSGSKKNDEPVCFLYGSLYDGTEQDIDIIMLLAYYLKEV
jgi:hypothetical protein